MTLRQFYAKEKLRSQKELADLIGVDRTLITHWFKGRRIPSRDMALRIEERTCGKVSFREAMFPAA